MYRPTLRRRAAFPREAKAVIFLFMSGGVSHVDSFDPKPSSPPTTASKSLRSPRNEERPGYEKLFPQEARWKVALAARAAGSERPVPPNSRNKRRPHVIRSCTPRTRTIQRHARDAQRSFAFARQHRLLAQLLASAPKRNLPSFLVLAPQMPRGQAGWAPTSAGAHRERGWPGANRRELNAACHRETQELELDTLKAFNETLLPDATTRNRGPASSPSDCRRMQSEMPRPRSLEESDATLGSYGLKRGQTDGSAGNASSSPTRGTRRAVREPFTQDRAAIGIRTELPITPPRGQGGSTMAGLIQDLKRQKVVR